MAGRTRASVSMLWYLTWTKANDGVYAGYKNVPFFISSNGYGVFVDHTDLVSYEVQSERMDKASLRSLYWVNATYLLSIQVQISVRGENIRVLILKGSTPKRILELYTTLLGRTPVPPTWTFGLWLTTSFLTSYDEKTVSSFVDGLKKVRSTFVLSCRDCFVNRHGQRDIPLGVFQYVMHGMIGSAGN